MVFLSFPGLKACSVSRDKSEIANSWWQKWRSIRRTYKSFFTFVSFLCVSKPLALKLSPFWLGLQRYNYKRQVQHSVNVCTWWRKTTFKIRNVHNEIDWHRLISYIVSIKCIKSIKWMTFGVRFEQRFESDLFLKRWQVSFYSTLPRNTLIQLWLLSKTVTRLPTQKV